MNRKLQKRLFAILLAVALVGGMLDLSAFTKAATVFASQSDSPDPAQESEKEAAGSLRTAVTPQDAGSTNPSTEGVRPEGEKSEGTDTPSKEETKPEGEKSEDADTPSKEEVQPEGGKSEDADTPSKEETKPEGGKSEGTDTPSKEETKPEGENSGNVDTPSKEETKPEGEKAEDTDASLADETGLEGEETKEPKEKETLTVSVNSLPKKQMRAAVRAASGPERSVSDWAGFLAALSDSSVSTIILEDNILSERTKTDVLLIIPRSVTIDGNGYALMLNEAGIVLGGNTTFKNITLEMLNPVCNAIIANGYTLTVDRVKNASAPGAYSIHLFCGQLTDYNRTASITMPPTGSHGQIIIRGENRLGHIFAGSLSDVASSSQSTSNDFTQQATITIDSSASGTIGNIYACGARESRGEGTGDILYPMPGNYKVSGAVTINLYGSLVRRVEGLTGSAANAALNYNGNNDLFSSLVATDLSALRINSGRIKPAAGSSLSAQTSISVADGTRLNLGNYSSLELSEFTGGGILILGEQQRLTISGNVSGTTKIAIGDISNTGQSSSKVPATSYPYIKAINSTEGSFLLLPYSGQPNDRLSRKADGSWMVDERGEATTILQSFSLVTKSQDIQQSNSAQGADFEVSLTFKTFDDGREFEELGAVPLTYKVEFGQNSYTAGIKEDGGYYTATVDSLNLNLEAGGDPYNGAWISVRAIDFSRMLSAGTYKITVTAPTESGSVEETFTLNVEAAGEASIGTTVYPTLKEAMASPEAQSGGATIRLLKDVNIASAANQLTIASGSITLDLDGKQISSTVSSGLNITGGSVTITDSTGRGVIKGSDWGIQVSGGTVNLNSGNVSGKVGIKAGEGTVNLNGARIMGTVGAGIVADNTNTGNPVVNLAGGEITGTNGPSFKLVASGTGSSSPKINVTSKLTNTDSPYTVEIESTGGTKTGVFAETTVDFDDFANCFRSFLGDYMVGRSGNQLILKQSIQAASVILTPNSGTYDKNKVHQPVVSVEIGGTRLTERRDYTVSYMRGSQPVSEMKDVGIYQIVISGTGNYLGTVMEPFTINKADAPQITFPSAGDITYGDRLAESSLIGGSTEYGSFAWKDGNLMVEAQGGQGFGTVVFMPNAETLKNYKPITSTQKEVSFTVHKGTPVVVVKAAVSSNTGSREATLTAEVKGVQGGKVPSGTLKFVWVTGNGEQEIASGLTLSGGKAAYTWKGLKGQIYQIKAVYDGDGNYAQASSDEYTFDMRKQAQATFDISNIGTKTYGDSDFVLKTTGGSGTGAVTFESSDPSVLSITGSNATIHKAGSVVITAVKAEDKDYNAAMVAKKITIERKTITFTAKNLTVEKGEAIPQLSFLPITLAYNDRIITAPILSCEAADTNTIGKFAITVSGGTLTNQESYYIQYVPGILEVKEPAQTGGGNTPDSGTNQGTGGAGGGQGTGGTTQNTTPTAPDTAAQNTAQTVPNTAVVAQNTAQTVPNTVVTAQNAAAPGTTAGEQNTARPGQRVVGAGQGTAAAETTEETVAAGNPFLKSTTEATGWEAIRQEIKAAENEAVIEVNMNGETLVPQAVLNDLKDRNVLVIFDMGEGISWKINGNSFSTMAKDVDFAVTVGTKEKPLNRIPQELTDRLESGQQKLELSLAHNGEFGFETILSFDVGKENTGYFANLFYFNEAAGQLEFIQADQVTEEGTAEFRFTHASEYILVLDTKATEENTIISAKTGDTPMESAEVQDKTVQEGSSGNLTWLIWIAVIAALAAAAGVVFAVSRNKKDGDRKN
ncbi:MAG: Ig-like domain repeat protein [Lachnospiraceae bacterium]